MPVRMFDETALAFAHPEARAEAITAASLPDRISLRDYILDTEICLLYTSPSPRDRTRSRMPSSA